MRKLLAGPVMALLLSSLACSGPAPEEYTTKDAGDIRQGLDLFLAAFNAKEVPKILDLYADTSVFMPPNEPIIRGRDPLKNFYDDLLVTKGAANLRMDIVEVSGHGPIAYLSGTYEMELKPSTGAAGRDRGKFLFVIRKMGNAWRYQYTMWNSDLPPMK